MATIGPANRRRRSQRESIIGLRIPAPIGGLNTVDDGDTMPPTDASLCYNLVAIDFAKIGVNPFSS